MSLITHGYSIKITCCLVKCFNSTINYNVPPNTWSANSFATSYWNTSTCIFGQAINDNTGSPGLVSKSGLLSTVLQHEKGHLLGLVNQGSPMQASHLDAANGAHCDNNNCLMYYGIESYAISNFVPEMDANCRADLKANGGK
jgi:hypothetical protein